MYSCGNRGAERKYGKPFKKGSDEQQQQHQQQVFSLIFEEVLSEEEPCVGKRGGSPHGSAVNPTFLLIGQGPPARLPPLTSRPAAATTNRPGGRGAEATAPHNRIAEKSPSFQTFNQSGGTESRPEVVFAAHRVEFKPNEKDGRCILSVITSSDNMFP